MDLNKGISPPVAILIVIVCAALVGGVAVWQYKKTKEAEAPKEEVPKEEVPKEEPKEIENWKTYINREYGFELKYPSLYKKKEIKKETFLQGQEVAHFSYQDSNSLVVSVFDKPLRDYRLVDEPGGYIFHFNENTKEWLHRNNQSSKFIPKKVNLDLEAYTYQSGDVNCNWDWMVIPHPSHSFVIEIADITCSTLDKTQKPYKYIPAPFDLEPEQILSTFKFTEPEVQQKAFYFPPEEITLNSEAITDWKEYKNELLGFSLRYPPNRELEYKSWISLGDNGGYRRGDGIVIAVIPKNSCRRWLEPSEEYSQAKVKVNEQQFTVVYKEEDYRDEIEYILVRGDTCYALTLIAKNISPRAKVVDIFHKVISSFKVADKKNLFLVPEKEDWKSYQNDEYEFTLKYPPTLELTENKIEKGPPIGIRNLFSEEENKEVIVRLLDKEGIAEHTSLMHVEIQVAVSQSESSPEQCIDTGVHQPTSNEEVLQEISEEYIKKGFTKTKEINGVTFYRMLRYGGAAMGGNYTSSDGFSTIHNDRCYEITLFIYGGGVASGAVSIPSGLEFPEEFIHETLFQVLDTFQFLD